MIQTQTVSCNLCGASNATFLFDARDRLHGIAGNFSYVRCNQCGLVYMNPQVVPNDVKNLYPPDYAPHSAKTGSSRRTARFVLNRILNVPIIAGLLKCLTNVKIARPVYRSIGPQTRVLDVGCGTGAFLAGLKNDKGCEVYGVDISQTAARQAKKLYGLDIFNGSVTEVPFPNAYFDIVTAWWYLEHVSAPNAATAKISDLLKDNGCCIIGVPNFESLFARIFKDKWYHLDCPRHLCIWTRSTITTLLTSHGLSVTRIMHDKTPWGLLGSLQYLIYSDNIHPKYRDRIRHCILLWVLLLPLTILLSLLKKSDIIVVYAKKTAAGSGSHK